MDDLFEFGCTGHLDEDGARPPCLSYEMVVLGLLRMRVGVRCLSRSWRGTHV